MRILLASFLVALLVATTACGGSGSDTQAEQPGTNGETGTPDPAPDDQPGGDSGDDSGAEPDDQTGAQGDPVPTPPPNAEGQEPAFPLQTRAPQADSGVAPKVREIATGLAEPWAIEFLPDGRLIMTERPGDLHIVTQDGQVSEPIAGVPEVDDRGQGGLLDVALAPDFEQSRMIYLSYAEPRADGKNGTTAARGTLSDDMTRLENVEVIFRQEPAWDSTHHYGSRLVWGPDGNLFITLGERSAPEPRKLAQEVDTHIGKVVRIAPDGAIPQDNPYVDADDALPEVWSYGHRNIQGATLHPGTDALWTIEHGPRGGDEINIPQPGKNYGWPVITYGIDYSGAPIGEGITKKEGMEQPIYYWDPVIAPSGMTFYQGEMFPEWQDDLLIASLNPGALVRLEIDGQRVVGEERLLEDAGRVRDVQVGPDGALWLVTDHSDGRLLKVVR